MAQTENRCMFPGFALTQIMDSETHEVEVGRIQDGGAVFVLHMIRPKELASRFQNLPFLVAQVDNEAGETLWSFKSEMNEQASIAILARADGKDIVIAFVERGKDGKVFRVLPLQQFLTEKPIGLRMLMRLKILAAHALNREHILSEIEQRVLHNDEMKRKQEAHLKRSAERKERVDRIVSRGRFSALSESGKRRSGFPVVGDEWMSLENGTFVILVESFDDETKVPGKPLEAFEVTKSRGKNPEKENPIFVSNISRIGEKTSKVTAPIKFREALIELGEDLFSVRLYATPELLEQVKASGLNGGTYIALDQKGKDGKIEVLSALPEGFKSVGKFVPLG